MAEAPRPKLSAMARLRRDARTGRHLLLSPERGLDLNPSATSILALCDGTRTLEEIVAELAVGAAGASRDVIARDVESFLSEMQGRGLIHFARDDQ
jgi:pyrroloquinoline quinone biosynthesis protein D